MINTEAALAFLPIDQPIYKILNVTACFPYTRMRNDAAFNAQDAIIELHHRPPPEAADIITQFTTQRPEVVHASNPAIDLGISVHIAAPLTQTNNFLNCH